MGHRVRDGDEQVAARAVEDVDRAGIGRPPGGLGGADDGPGTRERHRGTEQVAGGGRRALEGALERRRVAAEEVGRTGLRGRLAVQRRADQHLVTFGRDGRAEEVSCHRDRLLEGHAQRAARAVEEVGQARVPRAGEGDPDHDIGAHRGDREAELIAAEGCRIDEGAGEGRPGEAVYGTDVAAPGGRQEGSTGDDVVAECRDREPEARVARGGAFEGGQDAARRAVEAADRSRPTPAAGRADQEVGARGGDRRTEGRGREALAEHRLEPRGEQVGRTAIDESRVVAGGADQHACADRRHRGAEEIPGPGLVLAEHAAKLPRLQIELVGRAARRRQLAVGRGADQDARLGDRDRGPEAVACTWRRLREGPDQLARIEGEEEDRARTIMVSGGTDQEAASCGRHRKAELVPSRR